MADAQQNFNNWAKSQGGQGSSFANQAGNPGVQWVPTDPSLHGQHSTSGASGTQGMYGATGSGINDPSVNPNAYQYGGQAGGAAAFNQQLSGLAAAQAQQQGAQIQNQYDPRDQAQMQGVLGSLGNFYQGQLNGTGPSLASAQMQQATDQSIAAQMAAANSARGSLAGASAMRGASQQAAAMQQGAAQQAMQGRIQEEYNAAQGMQGVGQLSLGEQQANMQMAAQQAQLQEEQQKINAAAAQGYAGMENQTNVEQMNAQMAQQAQESQDYLAASGMGMNQSQFNTQQSNNMMMGGLGLGAGLLLAMADADFVEPPGADQRPAHDTLREQRTVDGRPFIAIADQNTGVVEKLATKPLTHAEARRVAEPHGAGPIFAQGAARAHTTFHDMPMAPMTLGPRGMPAAAPPMGGGVPVRAPGPAPGAGGVPPRALMPVGGMPRMPVAMPGAGPAPVRAAIPGAVATQPMPMPGPMNPIMAARTKQTSMVPMGGAPGPVIGPNAPKRPVADMDLSGVRRRTYNDATLGAPYEAPSTMVMPPGSMPPAGGPPPNPYDPTHTMALPASSYPQSAPAAAVRLGGMVAPHPTNQYGGGLAISMPTAPTAEQVLQAHDTLGTAADTPGVSGYVPFSRSALGATASSPSAGVPGTKANPSASGSSPFTQKMHAAGADILRSSLASAQSAQLAAYQPMSYGGDFQPMAVPVVSPMQMADMDLGGFPDERAQMYGILGSARVADMDMGYPSPAARAALTPLGSRVPPQAMTAGMAGLQSHMRRLQAADMDMRSRYGRR